MDDPREPRARGIIQQVGLPIRNLGKRPDRGHRRAQLMADLAEKGIPSAATGFGELSRSLAQAGGESGPIPSISPRAELEYFMICAVSSATASRVAHQRRWPPR